MSYKRITLILEDGSEFVGYSFGFENSVSGEVVFNTGMVGYPESLTDPSYRGQILVLTYPIVGNYGVPKESSDEFGLSTSFESKKIQVTGFIVSEYSEKFSHWNSEKTISQWLIENKIPAIFGVDTRLLTKKIREKGAMLGKILFDQTNLDFDDPNKRILSNEVCVKEPVVYGNFKKKVALIDCGVKNNIIRNLLKRKVSVIVFPHDYDIFNGEYEFDGILISNGPGDPQTMTAAVSTTKKALAQSKPIFGICFGNQILALAAGAKTYKLKYGHRGQNQPCQLIGTKKCLITSQNHGFAVDEKTLPKDWEPWFRNINDNTNEGIKHKTKPFRSVQFHPEACPGPNDTAFLFDEFVRDLNDN